MDIVELCKKYRNDGVVAIDLAGDESLNCKANPEHRNAYEVGACSETRLVFHSLRRSWVTAGNIQRLPLLAALLS